ncbi:hypothetical protein [Paraglaciecola chathamensis]|uniref:hypothetical protein n=1 Tax=Paraglaciecola chathamensis TaxID=368405 RepID=UPI002989ECBA|nr:hypothetical protein [Paraglaciecola chathamensis]
MSASVTARFSLNPNYSNVPKADKCGDLNDCTGFTCPQRYYAVFVVDQCKRSDWFGYFSVVREGSLGDTAIFYNSRFCHSGFCNDICFLSIQIQKR